ncbi:MAG: hypothetical protein M1817_004921 [Caeruleum heppii]|nr:MAG: hypothetical protein M1817_004921 [Caeruleum heppii]
MAGEVRQPIDIASLERYLELHVPEIETPIELQQFGYGQSNPTYLLLSPSPASLAASTSLTDDTDDTDDLSIPPTPRPSPHKKIRRYVLRKKPPGALLSRTAHQVDREYRVIRALQDTGVPVPRAVTLCEDEAVVGTKFYIMGFCEGRIFEDASLPDVTPEERTDMWRSAISTLARLHSIPPSSVGLTTFGPPSHFYARQLKTFSTISTSQADTTDIESSVPVGPIPHFDRMVDVFRDPARQPRDRATLIHGDYKIDNLVFHPTEPRVVGILDWEMSTIGHPLSDLSNLLQPFVTAPPKKTSSSSSTMPLSPRPTPAFTPDRTPGLPPRAELVRLYASIAGWDPTPELRWSDAFGIFRNSIIMQGIKARYARRQASSEKAKEYGDGTEAMGEFAWGLVSRLRGDDGEERGKAKL